MGDALGTWSWYVLRGLIQCMDEWGMRGLPWCLSNGCAVSGTSQAEGGGFCVCVRKGSERAGTAGTRLTTHIAGCGSSSSTPNHTQAARRGWDCKGWLGGYMVGWLAAYVLRPQGSRTPSPCPAWWGKALVPMTQ